MSKINQKTKIKKSKKLSHFMGEYHYVLDEKNRLTVPTKYRDNFTDGCVVTKGVDTCLFMFTNDAWNELAEHIAGLPMTQGNNRAYSRMLLGGAMDIQFDKQNRIIVPEYLREYAGLAKDVVLIGLYRRIEIWDTKTWNEYKRRIEADSPNIAENLVNFAL